MSEVGLVDCTSETATKVCWRLTRAGLVSLQPCAKLRAQRRIISRRAELARRQATVFEFYDLLLDDG